MTVVIIFIGELRGSGGLHSPPQLTTGWSQEDLRSGHASEASARPACWEGVCSRAASGDEVSDPCTEPPLWSGSGLGLRGEKCLQNKFLLPYPPFLQQQGLLEQHLFFPPQPGPPRVTPCSRPSSLSLSGSAPECGLLTAGVASTPRGGSLAVVP